MLLVSFWMSNRLRADCAQSVFKSGREIGECAALPSLAIALDARQCVEMDFLKTL
jgi:hypothetical protein